MHARPTPAATLALEGFVGPPFCASEIIPAPPEPWGYTTCFMDALAYHPDLESPLLFLPLSEQEQARRSALSASRGNTGAFVPWRRADLSPDTEYRDWGNLRATYAETPAGDGAEGPVLVCLEFQITTHQASCRCAKVLIELIPRPGEAWTDAIARIHPHLPARAEWEAVSAAVVRFEEWHRGEQRLRRTRRRLVTGYERDCRRQAELADGGGQWDLRGAEAGRCFRQMYGSDLPPLPREAAREVEPVT